MQLVNENVSRKIDSLGRISIPKGLRDRLSMANDTELNFYTLVTDKGEQMLCLAPTTFRRDRFYVAAEVLDELGLDLPKELRAKL